MRALLARYYVDSSIHYILKVKIPGQFICPGAFSIDYE